MTILEMLVENGYHMTIVTMEKLLMLNLKAVK